MHTQIECLKDTIDKEYDMIVNNLLVSICNFNHIAQTQTVSNSGLKSNLSLVIIMI